MNGNQFQQSPSIRTMAALLTPSTLSATTRSNARIESWSLLYGVPVVEPKVLPHSVHR